MKSLIATMRRPLGTAAMAGTFAVAAGCGGGISTQQEVQMGAQYAAEIERQLPMINDASINSYINQLGNRIAQRVDQRGIQYRFRVVNAPEVNAFAVPGGFIYVNRGLIDRSENMSELGGVLAHEIGHVVQRHSVEQMEKAQGANTLVNVVYGVLLGRAPSGVEQVAIQGGGSALFAHYTRDAEREADQDAVRFTVASGIHPRGIITMHEKLLQERQRSPGRVERWFATHPAGEERIAAVQQSISALPQGSLNNLAVNDAAYTQFKARLRQLPAAQQRTR